MGTRVTIRIAPLVLLFLATIGPLGARSAGAQQNPETTLPGCGIAYPAGYDINTAGKVQGRLLEIQMPDEGPVRLIVADGDEHWVVLASPAWFWKMTELSLAPGDTVTVSGSKTLGADGTLYLIARDIRLPGSEATISRIRYAVIRDCGTNAGVPCGATATAAAGCTAAAAAMVEAMEWVAVAMAVVLASPQERNPPAISCWSIPGWKRCRTAFDGLRLAC